MLTGYGTKWLWPFNMVPFTGDSVFIIDPLYTVPFLFLLLIALTYPKSARKRRVINGMALLLTTSYLLRGIFAKQRAHTAFVEQLDQQGIAVTSLHASPEALTTFLRRGRADDEKNRYLGRWSIFDTSRNISRKVIPKNHELLVPYINDADVKKLLARRKYNVVARSTPQGVQLIPIQFGDLFGWREREENFMFGYLLYKDTQGNVAVSSSRWGEGIPKNWLNGLLQRVKGI